ncbi:hypothetical protein [Laceyella tengchongensis]|uniref:Uncharacterized protein n=1 Tax=Laceyella tengchongensis TaxID=574699 RepID=A0AA46AE23_9BACL|nr:hypothetical protein [Laceyella tengchongensis]SMP09904.1 hypothetical protein SAMN06265361_102129 [Laceyella tengchongensis]
MVDFQLGTMLFQIAAFLAFVFFFLIAGYFGHQQLEAFETD